MSKSSKRSIKNSQTKKIFLEKKNCNDVKKNYKKFDDEENFSSWKKFLNQKIVSKFDVRKKFFKLKKNFTLRHFFKSDKITKKSKIKLPKKKKETKFFEKNYHPPW